MLTANYEQASVCSDAQHNREHFGKDGIHPVSCTRVRCVFNLVVSWKEFLTQLCLLLPFYIKTVCSDVWTNTHCQSSFPHKNTTNNECLHHWLDRCVHVRVCVNFYLYQCLFLQRTCRSFTARIGSFNSCKRAFGSVTKGKGLNRSGVMCQAVAYLPKSRSRWGAP